MKIQLHTRYLICTKKEMKIAVENGYIQILSFNFGKEMTTSEFLNGLIFY
jgi:methionyl-tRNA formyltransferase